MYISQPDYGEQALDIVDALIKSEGCDCIVVDSVAALTPKAELEGDMGDHHIALQARLMSLALRKITASVSRTGVLLIFINQIRSKVGVFFGSSDTTPGGSALRFYSSVRMDIRRGQQIKSTQGINQNDVIGTKLKVKIAKNKMAPPFANAEFDLLFSSGIDILGEILDLGAKLNLVEKSGSWYSIPSGLITVENIVDIHEKLLTKKSQRKEENNAIEFNTNSDEEYEAKERDIELEKIQSTFKDIFTEGIILGQGRDKARLFLDTNPGLTSILESMVREKLQSLEPFNEDNEDKIDEEEQEEQHKLIDAKEAGRTDFVEQETGIFIEQPNLYSKSDNVVEEGGIEFEESALKMTLTNNNISEIPASSLSLKEESNPNESPNIFDGINDNGVNLNIDYFTGEEKQLK